MGGSLYQPFPMAVPGARAQVWHHQPSFRRPRHFHAEPELNLVVSGKACFGVGDAQIGVEAGDLLWFTPGQDHVLLDASRDLDLFVFAVTLEFSSRVLGPEPARRALTGPVCANVSGPNCTRLRDLSEAGMGPHSAAAIEQQVGDLWREANTLRLVPPNRHALTRQALLALAAEPELARSELAARMGVWPGEVSRHFHHDIGLTLVEFRTRIRLLQFIHAVESGRSLTAAAFEAGFGSYSQCHRAFQRTLGHGPREFFRHDLRARMAETLATEPIPRIEFSHTARATRAE